VAALLVVVMVAQAAAEAEAAVDALALVILLVVNLDQVVVDLVVTKKDMVDREDYLLFEQLMLLCKTRQTITLAMDMFL
jgi:hypothetical protein